MNDFCLKEKPTDLIFSSVEFSEFQSRIMTEFWAAHKDLAEDFGKQIKYAHQKVEDAIKSGQFEKLKAEIDIERAERIRAIEKMSQTETGVTKKTSEKINEQAKTDNIRLVDKKDFLNSFKSYFNKYQALPNSYIREYGELVFNNFPQEIVSELNEAIKKGGKLPKDILDKLVVDDWKKGEFLTRMKRIQRAIEGAIAIELYDKMGNPEFFKMPAPQLTNILEQRVKDVTLPKHLKPNVKRIDIIYNDFKNDVETDIGNDILSEYFSVKADDEQVLPIFQELADYLDTYGKSTKILFSGAKYYTDEAKFAFSQKFIKLMPQSLKDKFDFAFNDMNDIKQERELAKLRWQLFKRFNFIPKDVVNRYIRSVCSMVRFNNVYQTGFNLKTVRELTQKAHTGKTYNFLRVNKSSFSIEDKLKLLAIEQALEDEMYNLTKNPVVFSWEFEEAVSHWEMLSEINPKAGGITIYNDDKTNILHAKEKPNPKNIVSRYFKYYNEIKGLANDIQSYKDKIDTDALLEILTSTNKTSEREKNIKKRIQQYF